MISRRALIASSLALLALPPVWAATPSLTADQILARIDQNLTFESRSSRMTMTVTKNGRVKTYEIVSYGRGAEEGASEYLSPARDAGTKMLKKGDELWMYMPSVEKVQKISGHMLRQGMMGSDLSYEDMLESDDWRSNYNAVALADEALNGRPCWVLDLTAKSEDVSYPRRKVWVDQAWLLPVRQELYALSGMLLKVWIMSDPKQYGERWYPMKMTVEDKLQQGSKTEIVFTEMLFSVPLEEEIFTTRWLERR
ncbi:outer membrane lipoprotein-sorting protein [Myxococcota bacterium]|jgi:outer membrane lipoprotein-sorting protein|nr:outer membrane lipoprotein-sorting protein [Myxococcota bacterium]